MLIHRLIKRALRAPDDETATTGGAAPEAVEVVAEQTTETVEKVEKTESAPAEGADDADEAEETVVMLGDEALPPPEQAPQWVKQLRQRFREVSAENARLRGAPAGTEPSALPPAAGPKPKISDPEIDFDADKFAAAIDKWHEASRKRDEAERKARDTHAQEQRAWEQTVAAYQSAGAKLGFADYEDCEAATIAALSPTQQAIIVQGADSAEKAALIMYSLGRNMKLLQDVAGIADPVKFAFQIAQLQGKLTVTKRKPTTKPESTVPASGTSAAAVLAGEDKRLEELRAEAMRTNDMTKLMAYQRQRREKQRA